MTDVPADIAPEIITPEVIDATIVQAEAIAEILTVVAADQWAKTVDTADQTAAG